MTGVSETLPRELSDGKVRCHKCKKDFSRIGYHWTNGSCDFPDIPGELMEYLVGAMMGDATLRTRTKHPSIQLYMANKGFLEWLDDKLGWLSTGVSLYRTAESSADISRNNGHPDADPTDYSDIYALRTRTMKAFERFESWYAGGTKTFPPELVLTPGSLGVWYACDGSLNYDRRYPNSRPYLTIGVGANLDNGNVATIRSMFTESDAPIPPTIDSDSVRFTVNDSKDVLQWMEGPFPGIEYKWETDGLMRYDRSKREALRSAEHSG